MRKTLPSVVLLLTSLLLAAQTANASGKNSWGFFCDAEPLTNFWEDAVGFDTLSGRGHMCATRYGTIGSLAVRGLTPGNAYTVWWVYFDKPQQCSGFPLTPDVAEVPAPEPVGYADNCGLADFFTPDSSGEFLNPLAVYGRMDSVVAVNKRRTFFRGNIRDFEPAPGSQMWMFIFGHGPADQHDKRQLARQLLTPEDPLSGVPHLGIEGRPFGYPAGVVVIDIPE
ncbi:MAG: hypothetical protein AAGH76_16900 [Pseudomonadota bacterium]